MEKPAIVGRKPSAVVLKNVSSSNPLYVLSASKRLLKNMFFIKKMFIHDKESYLFQNQNGATINLNFNSKVELEIYSPE